MPSIRILSPETANELVRQRYRSAAPLDAALDFGGHPDCPRVCNGTVALIDARAWTRPSPDEIRAMIECLRNGRSMKDTTIEIAARLGRNSRRAVFHWMSPKQEPGRQISYCEWLALSELVKEERK